MIIDLLDANELRLRAEQCAARAEQIVAQRAERERLLIMKESLLALADTADWLSGRSHDLALQNAAE
jgi:hypothetical protein